MAMPLRALALIAAAAIGLAPATGCGHSSPVGSWQTLSSSGSAETTQSTIYTFRPDNTVTIERHMSYGPLQIQDTDSGTYALSDSGGITITLTSRSVGMDPAAQRAVFQRLAQMHPGAAASLPQTAQGIRSVPVKNPAPEAYKWRLKDKDTLDLETDTKYVANNQLIELTRVKP